MAVKKEPIAVDNEVKQYIKLETIIMAGIFAVMSWAGWNLQQMQVAIERLSSVAVSNQVKIDSHIHDNRAHVNIKNLHIDD